MARVKRGVTSHARHKKVLKQASGYRGRSSSCYRIALQRVEKALQYAYRDRRCRKRDMRGLWIQRINAAARQNGITYSDFMSGLRKLQLSVNRKILADLAVVDAASFRALTHQVKEHYPCRAVMI